MDDFYIDLYKKHLNDICAGCKHCDFDTVNVGDADDFYHGYDGTVICDNWDKSKEEDNNNRLFISPISKKCDNFIKADRYDYLKQLALHIAYALTEFPKGTKGKTEQEVFNNVLDLYKRTIELYKPTKEIVYDKEFFDQLVNLYNKDIKPGHFYEVEKEITNLFIKRFY